MKRVTAMLALGFFSCGTVCPQREAFTTADGGALTCIVSTDCPRPANVLVCGQTEDHLRDCIACEDTRCVRYRPLACP